MQIRYYTSSIKLHGPECYYFELDYKDREILNDKIDEKIYFTTLNSEKKVVQLGHFQLQNCVGNCGLYNFFGIHAIYELYCKYGPNSDIMNWFKNEFFPAIKDYYPITIFSLAYTDLLEYIEDADNDCGIDEDSQIILDNFVLYLQEDCGLYLIPRDFFNYNSDNTQKIFILHE
jgi:hypothetical protein